MGLGEGRGGVSGGEKVGAELSRAILRGRVKRQRTDTVLCACVCFDWLPIVTSSTNPPSQTPPRGQEINRSGL